MNAVAAALSVAGNAPVPVLAFTAAADAVLGTQTGVIRRRLRRRTRQVLAGADPSRSRVHLYYVAAEIVKVVALIALGTSILAVVR